MFDHCRRVSVRLFFLAWAAGTISHCGWAQPDKQTVRFIEDVLVNSEFEHVPVQLCKKWKAAPRISTFGPDSHHPAVIKNVVDQLNRCLPADKKLKILEPNDDNATLKIYFVALEDFETVAGEQGFSYIEDNWGFFYTWWNGDYEIERATVLIAHDKMNGSRLHHFVLEEVTQSLGFPGDSKRFEKSVFFEDKQLRRFGTATRLSELDAQLIRFHYLHNQAGQTPVELGINIAKKWKD